VKLDFEITLKPMLLFFFLSLKDMREKCGINFYVTPLSSLQFYEQHKFSFRHCSCIVFILPAFFAILLSLRRVDEKSRSFWKKRHNVINEYFHHDGK